jgi:two-component system chemotaxis response regulator CheY
MDSNLQILVVDDFSTMRRIIRNLLAELGLGAANVHEAEDGEQALNVLRDTRIDLAITDWNMPGISGLGLLRSMRADPALANIPVLMVTAENNRDQIVAAAEVGVNGYIVKPFTTTVLEEKIERIFKRLADERR